MEWFDETFVVSVGVAVQLEQRSGDHPAAVVGRKRGQARKSKSVAAAIIAKKFLVLAEDIHNAILDELEGGDVLADELKQPML